MLEILKISLIYFITIYMFQSITDDILKHVKMFFLFHSFFTSSNSSQQKVPVVWKSITTFMPEMKR